MQLGDLHGQAMLCNKCIGRWLDVGFDGILCCDIYELYACVADCADAMVDT